MTPKQQAIATKLGIKSSIITPAKDLKDSTAEFWKIDKNSTMELKRIPFRNGEHHVVGIVNGEEKTWPACFWEIEFV